MLLLGCVCLTGRAKHDVARRKILSAVRTIGASSTSPLGQRSSHAVEFFIATENTGPWQFQIGLKEAGATKSGKNVENLRDSLARDETIKAHDLGFLVVLLEISTRGSILFVREFFIAEKS